MELFNSLLVFNRLVAISLCLLLFLLAIASFPTFVFFFIMAALLLTAVGFISVLGRVEDRMKVLLDSEIAQQVIKSPLLLPFVVAYDLAMGLVSCMLLLPCMVIGSKLLGFVEFSKNLDAGLQSVHLF
ncbi:MAG: hypothetical protein IPP97_27645 [Candidatus Obscuribacter sp.]|jgi:hypothetical protein|nr:hypothetical protein [Candidatus Obscuribacter sp.]